MNKITLTDNAGNVIVLNRNIDFDNLDYLVVEPRATRFIIKRPFTADTQLEKIAYDYYAQVLKCALFKADDVEVRSFDVKITRYSVNTMDAEPQEALFLQPIYA